MNKQDFLQERLMDTINEFDENFSEVFGLEILTEFQPLNNSLTSVVISPDDNQVYVSLNKNADEVWRLDINGGTVETHTGFDKNHKANIPKLGITSSDLKILNFSNEDLTRGIISIAIVILFIILISIVLYLPRDNQNQTDEMT
jgi:WD40 repeat protein